MNNESWEWFEEPPDRLPKTGIRKAWSIASKEGDTSYELPSVVIPTGRKLYRIVPPEMGWEEYEKKTYKSLEVAKIVAKFKYISGAWKI